MPITGVLMHPLRGMRNGRTMPDLVYSWNPQVSYRVVGGEVFIITVDRAFHRVQVPSAVDIVLALSQAPKVLSELVILVTTKYRVEKAQATADLEAFLQLLVAQQIVVAD